MKTNISNNDSKSVANLKKFTLEPDNAEKVFTLMATPEPGPSKNHSTFRDITQTIPTKSQKNFRKSN